MNGSQASQQQGEGDDDEEEEEEDGDAPQWGEVQWGDHRRLSGDAPRRQRRRRSAGEANAVGDAGTRREVARLLESTRSSLSDGSDGDTALQGNRSHSPGRRRRSADGGDPAAENARLRRWRKERGVGLQEAASQPLQHRQQQQAPAAASPTTAQGAASAAQLREVLGSPSTRRRRRQHLKQVRHPASHAGPQRQRGERVAGNGHPDGVAEAGELEVEEVQAARNGGAAGVEAEEDGEEGRAGSEEGEEEGDGWDIWQQAAEVATTVTKGRHRRSGASTGPVEGEGDQRGRHAPVPARPKEALVTAHREQMHVMMEMVTKEMSLLEEMDNPRADGAAYAEALAAVMDRKQGAIDRLRHQIGAYCDAVARRDGEAPVDE